MNDKNPFASLSDMKYLFVIFCFLLFIFACQSDLPNEIRDNSEDVYTTYGKAVYGKSKY